MKVLTSVLAVGITALAAQTSAGDWKGQPLAVKRQLVGQVIGCMKKRMAADRLVSYNRALKECREQAESRLDKDSAGPLVAADTRGK